MLSETLNDSDGEPRPHPEGSAGGPEGARVSSRSGDEADDQPDQIVIAQIDIDPKKHNYGRRATLCETLFGIIPGHFTSKSNIPDVRIRVSGLIPDREV